MTLDERIEQFIEMFGRLNPGAVPLLRDCQQRIRELEAEPVVIERKLVDRVKAQREALKLAREALSGLRLNSLVGESQHARINAALAKISKALGGEDKC